MTYSVNCFSNFLFYRSCSRVLQEAHIKKINESNKALVKKMSTSVSIDFQFNKTSIFNPVSILYSLVEFGWSYGDRYIAYFPLCDNDSIDWQREEIIHWPKMKKILTQKAANKEMVGIYLLWPTGLTGDECLIGAQFLFETKESQLLVNLMTRKRIKGLERATDFIWYLEKLLPPLEKLKEKLNLHILEIICEELRY